MRSLVPVVMVSLAFLNTATAQYDLRIELGSDSPAEEQTKTQLEKLLRDYDVSKWVFTSEVRIDDDVRTPFSHPILTLSTNTDDDFELLSNFIHEQIHWFEELHPDQKESAIAELKAIYPDAPGGPPEGARSQYSTYLHLLVCYLEYEALQALVGMPRATEMLSSRRYYAWVYRMVLDEGERIRVVMEKHELTI